MDKGQKIGRLRRWVLAATLAALLAAGAGGAGVAGDPSQWSLNDNQTQMISINFAKIEL